MQPIIHQSQLPLDPQALPELPWQRFATDWYGAPLDFQAEFLLLQDPMTLYLAARCDLPAPAEPDTHRGAFLAGLWQGVVAEVFLKEPAPSARYTEWNLSPGGAWWNQGFVCPREADPEFIPPASVYTSSQPWGANGWQAVLGIPWAGGSLQDHGINVTMIVQGPTAERSFLSCARLPDIAPDFHQPDHYPLPIIRPYFPDDPVDL